MSCELKIPDFKHLKVPWKDILDGISNEIQMQNVQTLNMEEVSMNYIITS